MMSPSNKKWAKLGTLIQCSQQDFTIIFYEAGKNPTTQVLSHRGFLEARLPKMMADADAESANEIEADLFILPSWVQKRPFRSFHELCRHCNTRGLKNVKNELFPYTSSITYLYTDEFPIQGEYSMEYVGQVLKLGQTYCPDEMGQICDQIVKLTLPNVFEFQRMAKQLNIKTLSNMVSKYIGRNENVSNLINTVDFLSLQKESLIELLKSDELKISEIDLFMAVVRWGRNQPGSSSQSDTNLLKTILQDVINLIRFPLMTCSDFAKNVVNLGLLSSQDTIELYTYWASDNNTNTNHLCTQWSKVPRGGASGINSIVKNENATETSVIQDSTESVTNQDVFVSSSAQPPQTSTVSPQEEIKYETEQDTSNFTCFDIISLKVPSWKQLLKELTQKSCQSLTGTVLNCTDVSGTKINVPNLNNIVLDLTMPLKTTKDILALRSDFDLEPYLFFQNITNTETSLFQLVSSKVNFELIINGIKFLNVNWPLEKLHIGFGGEKLCSSTKLSCLLSQFLFNFTKLSLVDLKFPNTIANRVCFLTDLTLFEVRGLDEVLNPKTSTKLGLFLLPHLTTLNCWFKTTTDGKKTHLNLNHLSIGTELKRLSVHNGTIITPDNRVFSFKSLTELYSDSCHWDKDIIDNFVFIFSNLQRVSFSSSSVHKNDNNVINRTATKDDDDDNDDNNVPPTKKSRTIKDISELKQCVPFVTVELLNNLLRIKSLTWIRMTSLKLLEQIEEQHHSLEKFLADIRLRIEKGKPFNFVLERNDRQIWEILYDGIGNQSQQNRVEILLNEMFNRDYEDRDGWTYDLFQINNIFRDVETFKGYK